jgi:uncharacterized protein (DUF1800 family)
MAQSFAAKAAFRFGYGFTPGEPDVRDINGLLAQISGQDTILKTIHGPAFPQRVELMQSYFKLRNDVKSGNSAAKPKLGEVNRARNRMRADDMRRVFQRAVLSPQGFRERLVYFWADHFTIIPKARIGQAIWGTYQEEAIRPHVGGTFGDILVAAVTHPSMLLFLDQVKSVGPNSQLGKRKKLGLNENLAREVLELHTLGVGGGYNQADVRQLAELLTGLMVKGDGPIFDDHRAEPGNETILGKTYGGDPAKLSDIAGFLRDVAVHPDTARHIARKLVIHFVSDEPDAKLVDHVAQAFSKSGGDLPTVYAAFLDHPGAWVDLGQKARQPFDFAISAFRAFGAQSEVFEKLTVAQVTRRLDLPLQTMGQSLRKAPGPNGWPEEAEAWITAQGLAARLQWALAISRQLGQNLDPRDFVDFALRDLAGGTLKFAVSGAEQHDEGLTLVLASPEFNRR